MELKNNIDEILNLLGVKTILLQYDYDFEIQKEKAFGGPLKAFVCELSWGNGDDGDETDFATWSNGDSPGEAMQRCVDMFIDLVKRGDKCANDIVMSQFLKKLGIQMYEKG